MYSQLQRERSARQAGRRKLDLVNDPLRERADESRAPTEAEIRERVRREFLQGEIAGRRRLDSSQRRDALYRRPLALSDALAYLAAIWLGSSVIGGVALTPWVFAGIPVTLVFAKLLDLYDRDENQLYRATLDDVPGLFQLATIVTLIAVLAQHLIAEDSLSGLDILATWLSLTALLVLFRTASRGLLNRLAQPERCVLIGDERTTEDLARRSSFRTSTSRSWRRCPPTRSRRNSGPATSTRATPSSAPSPP